MLLSICSETRMLCLRYYQPYIFEFRFIDGYRYAEQKYLPSCNEKFNKLFYCFSSEGIQISNIVLCNSSSQSVTSAE